MKTMEDLRKTLRRIDRKGYKAYKDIEGSYDFKDYTLFIDHVQGDPFAAPTRARARMRHDYPEHFLSNRSRETALMDYLTRRFAAGIRENSKGMRGTGKGGIISIDEPGQEIIERTSVIIRDSHVEARFEIGLPAFGRRIAADHAEEMLFREIPSIVSSSLPRTSVEEEELMKHVTACEDADALREKLDSMGLVCFVADNSILPRKSGVSQKPLENAVPFISPESLKKEVKLPNRTLTGMGIPKGITLIVGGGYHGKSTLLNAVELGIYNHLPGDGREFVVTSSDAVKIRAEDGRSIAGADISPFIGSLPMEKDTSSFSTPNASGSTSQAANIIEALEAGAKAILIDEDTSATNFMIRDRRMQELVPKEREPITPYIDRARQLSKDMGASTILVIGGSGAYFDIADTVICMVDYLPYEMTEKARQIAESDKSARKAEGGDSFGRITERVPAPESIDPVRGKKVKIRADSTRGIMFGRSTIDLSGVEQLADKSQTTAIGLALLYAKKRMNGKALREILDAVMDDIREQSLDVLAGSPSGRLAMFRRHELAAALNRLRTLRTKQRRE